MSIENIISAISLRVKEAVAHSGCTNSSNQMIFDFLQSTINEAPMFLGMMLVLLDKQPTIFSSFFDDSFNKNQLAETLDRYFELQAKREAKGHDHELFKYRRALNGLETLLTAHVAFNTEKPQFMTFFDSARSTFFMGCRDAGKLIQSIAVASRGSFEDVTAWAMMGNEDGLLIEPRMAALLGCMLFLMRSGDDKYQNAVYPIVFHDNAFHEAFSYYKQPCFESASYKYQDLRVEYQGAANKILRGTNLIELVKQCRSEKGGTFESIFCSHGFMLTALGLLD